MIFVVIFLRMVLCDSNFSTWFVFSQTTLAIVICGILQKFIELFSINFFDFSIFNYFHQGTSACVVCENTNEVHVDGKCV